MKQYKSFATLPKSWRTAYHGTTSLFLDEYKKGGIRVFRHPILEEIKEKCKAICTSKADPERAEKWAHSMGMKIPPPVNKSDAWHIHWNSEVGLWLRPNHGLVSMTGEFSTAISYAIRAPEFRYYLFEEFPADFEKAVKAVFGNAFDAQVQRIAELKSDFSLQYAKAQPVVLEVVLPDFSYFGGERDEDEMVKYIRNYVSQAKEDSGFLASWMNMRIDTPHGKEFVLSKPLGWEHVLKVHYDIGKEKAFGYRMGEEPPTLYAKYLKRCGKNS